MRHALTTALIVGCLNASPASADSPADAIRDFGLIGTWAIHCDQPVSQENAFVVYEIRDGTPVRMTRTYWQEQSDPATILEARILDGTRLQQTWKLRDFTFDQIIEMRNGRYRLLRSKGGDGNMYFDDGRNTADGSETPWLEKCPQ